MTVRHFIEFLRRTGAIEGAATRRPGMTAKDDDLIL